MDKQQELVEIIGYSGHISDFAIRIEREELLYVVWWIFVLLFVSNLTPFDPLENDISV
jgi:hypothetical protein